jgi:hypothetical protein
MVPRWMRAAGALALAPAAALAFDAVDTIPFPSRGAFLAYPAEPSRPTRVWAQAGAMRDSNPFRLADGADTRAVLGRDERSDTVMRYGLGISHVARVYGRQEVRLEARSEYYDYQRYSVLDHLAYGVLGEWLWELGNDLSGTVGYGRTRALADLGGVGRPLKDEITSDRLFAAAAYRFAADWRLRGAAEHSAAERSGGRRSAETDATTVRAGIDYITPLANAIGVEVRRTEGDAALGPVLDPIGLFANNEYTERELAMVLTYNLGAQLRVSGRLGRTERTYTELPVEGFDGTTGRGRVEWRPGNKTTLVLEAYKEPRVILDIDATHVVARGTAFGPSWAPTAKLVLSARLVTERHQYQSTADTGLPQRDDTLRIWRLGAGWEPVRRISVGAGIDRGERTSNTLGRDYEYTAISANLRYEW